jgi:hypothetical protein
MAIGGRIECTNYATSCHRLATTEIDGKPFCPSCATAIRGAQGGYLRTRYNQGPTHVAHRNTRLAISRPQPQKAG